MLSFIRFYIKANVKVLKMLKHVIMIKRDSTERMHINGNIKCKYLFPPLRIIQGDGIVGY